LSLLQSRSHRYVLHGLLFKQKADTATEYRTKTFTFYLTPEFVTYSTALAKLLDRKVVFSYQSFLLLKENGFSFDKAFSQGVPYLSRSEATLAGSSYLAKSGPQTAAYTRSLDTWSRRFFNDTRNDILSWLETNPESVGARRESK
jgi:poly(A)-specific ribonuclease